jgi:hypothetical protein
MSGIFVASEKLPRPTVPSPLYQLAWFLATMSISSVSAENGYRLG